MLAEGSLLVGAEDGVHDPTGAFVDVRGVEQTYNLNAFHRDGSLKPFTANAPVSGGTVTVPDGGLAEVTVGVGSGTDPEAPAPAVTEDEVRHLRIRFEYGLSNPVTFDRFAPRTQEGTLEATVRAWAAFFPGATFVVIGRCCDLRSDAYNATLATNRANAVAAWPLGVRSATTWLNLITVSPESHFA